MQENPHLSTPLTNPTRVIYPSPGFEHYWNHGSGKKMLETIERVPNKAEIEQQIPLLLEYDALADRVINEVYGTMGFRQANELLDRLLKHGLDSEVEIPESLRLLLEEVFATPAWLNPTLLEVGSAFCRRSGTMGFLVLRNYCLMGGYESSAINKPLIFTEALQKGAPKRIAETVEFWVNATGENALQPFQIGFNNAIKIRLMHAYARVSILNSSKWETSSWGIPLNQWDMVATNLGFSWVFMDGLKKLGLRPTDEEIKGVLHLWKYIGFLLGIPPTHLPDTANEAIEALYKWTITQPPSDADTKALATSLMNEPFQIDFPKYNWQKKLVVNIHLQYNQFFLGKRSCASIGLPSVYFNTYPHIVAFFNRMKEGSVHQWKSSYRNSVKRGRKKQEKVKDLFMKGYESMNH